MKSYLKVQTVLRAIGIPVLIDGDFTRPHVYVTVFLDRLGAVNEPWLYVGKHGGRSMRYLGSGSLIRQAIKKHGRECFKRFVIQYAKDAVKNECKAELKWLRRLNACNDSRFFNLSETSDGFVEWTQNMRALKSASSKQMWRDLDKRKTQVELGRIAMTQQWQDPIHCERQRQRMRSVEERKRRSAQSRKMWQDPAHRQQVIESMKRTMSNPSYQKQQRDNALTISNFKRLLGISYHTPLSSLKRS